MNSCVPRPLHVNSSTPSPSTPASNAAQILVGGFGVPHLELHRLPDLDLFADGQRPRLLVDPEEVADEEVAAPEVEVVLVDDEADVEALAHEPAVLVAGGLHDLLQPVHRGHPRELVREVALGARDRERLADRAASLRHDGADGHVVGAHHADRTARHDPVIEHDAVPARSRGRRRHPADHREPRHPGVAQTEEVGHRERERVGEHEERPARRQLVGPARDREPVVGPDRVERHAGDPARAEPGREHREPRRAFHFHRAASDADRGAADEHFRFEQLAQAARDVFERPHVVCRREAHEEIRAFAVELLDDLAGDLAHGLVRHRVQRQRGRVAIHEIHATADSAPITPGLRAITAGAGP